MSGFDLQNQLDAARIQRVFILLIAFSLCSCGGLPDVSGRPSSSALAASQNTKIARAVQPRVEAHPGQSGFHLMPNGQDAFGARLVLADAAQRSLDLQYFIWTDDLTGKVLLEHLIRAAD